MIRHLLLAVAVSPALAGSGWAALTQSFQQTGQLGLEVVGAAGLNTPPANGNLLLSNVNGPVVQATLYFSDFNNSGAGLDVSFAGNPAVTVPPFAQDLSGFSQVFAYQIDVTPFIPGPGLYSYTIGGIGANAIPGLALAVVYQDPSASTQTTVTIIDGVQQVGETGPETENAAFTGQPAGPTSLSVFTVLDDASSTGEVVSYNGNNLGGPLDAALGFNATQLNFNTVSQAGNNTIAITTGNDTLAWLLATSLATPGPIIPEPSTAALCLIGLLALRFFLPPRRANSR